MATRSKKGPGTPEEPPVTEKREPRKQRISAKTTSAPRKRVVRKKPGLSLCSA